MASSVPIPEPPGYPIIGNLGEFSPENPLADILRLADQYGEIYRLNFVGKSMVLLSTNALVNEVCDEKRFQKSLNSVLKEVRAGVNDGLFTARADEPNWGIAHRVLIPAFGPVSIKNMFPEMYDIAAQLAMKWARHGPETPIMVSEDFTRLALDTIALCSMDFRFNSYYRDEMHPFIQAMGDFLIESGRRNRRPEFASFFYRSAERKYQADIELMRRTANEVLQARKKNPNGRKDLLDAMLNGVDPRTGQKMTDASITDNLITFLIAGHETTSGMLSFAFYEMLKHPATYQKAQKEVDDVIGRNPVKVEDLSKLPYIAAVLRETLRLCATIPAFGLEAKEDTLLAGKYFVKKGEPLICLLGKAHLDPQVYGDDAAEFRPERMLDENFEKLQREFPNSWKPFGNGQRACIGRPFAWQEALLCMAMLLQNFDFVFDDPNYKLQIAETLTIKPKGLYMRATLRHDMSPTELEHRLAGTPMPVNGHAQATSHHSQNNKATASGKPMSIYYGSNSGTCESLAQRLASDALAHGFHATVVEPLDSAKEKLPSSQPVVVVTASYEGQPPDNASQFVAWIESLKGNNKAMDNVSYAVYGCGHHDWVQTFHRIPKLVDSTLAELGATRLVEMGLTDAAERDMFSDFETWEDNSLWPALMEKYNVAEPTESASVQPGLTVTVSTPRSSTLRQDVQEAIVIETKALTKVDQYSSSIKKHIEIQLPTNMSYRPGDYLAVLPLNPRESVNRVMRKFHLAWDAHLTISAEGRTALPTNQSIAAADILSAYVELAQPATRRNILALMEASKDATTVEKLQKLAGDDYSEKITQKRVSVLDLLEEFPSISLPIGSFLSMLPPMRVRQYSISSSPLWNPKHVTLTYSVLDSPSYSGRGRHVGVASSYLCSLSAGDKLHVTVRPSHVAFHLPVDAENVPVICIGAGTGLAPFRGFIQERAAMLGAGRTLAPAIVFFGCRSPDSDVLYREEFERWEKLGAVKVHHAFSKAPEQSHGCKHVQDRLYHDREEVYKLWNQGAKVYICGSRELGKGVEDVCVKLVMEAKAKNGEPPLEEVEARKWWEGVRNERYATDVFD